MAGYFKNYYQNLSDCQWRLLKMATLPLLDGFYVSMLGSGQLDNVWTAIQFGCVAFSGGACIAAVAEDRADWRYKLFYIFFVYMLVSVSATVMAIFKPQMQAIFPDNLHFLTASFLIALAFAISGWKLPFKLDNIFNCKVIIRLICAMLLFAVITNIGVAISMPFHIEWGLIANVNIGSLNAFLLTSSGIALGAIINEVDTFDIRAFQWGQSVSLLLIAAGILGAPVPSFLTIVPIIAGFLAGVVTAFQL